MLVLMVTHVSKLVILVIMDPTGVSVVVVPRTSVWRSRMLRQTDARERGC